MNINETIEKIITAIFDIIMSGVMLAMIFILGIATWYAFMVILYEIGKMP